MSHERDGPTDDPRDRSTDERIRQLMSDPPCPDQPTEIRSRVFSRVRRRRAVSRGAYALATVSLLITFGFMASRLLDPNPQRLQQMTQYDEDPQPSDEPVDSDLADLDPDCLNVPPPVLSLDLIAASQYATLDCLQLLGEERE